MKKSRKINKFPIKSNCPPFYFVDLLNPYEAKETATLLIEWFPTDAGYIRSFSQDMSSDQYDKLIFEHAQSLTYKVFTRYRMNFEPKNDGVDHINVYSKGKTELGRKLTNFAKTPFFCEDGKFQSMEGYWYWLLCHKANPQERNKLRNLSGFAAKKLGRELDAKDWPRDEQKLFRGKIKAAFVKKLEANPEIAQMLLESDLPLVHYYAYGEKIVYDGRSDWLMEYIEQVRTELKSI